MIMVCYFINNAFDLSKLSIISVPHYLPWVVQVSQALQSLKQITAQKKLKPQPSVMSFSRLDIKSSINI